MEFNITDFTDQLFNSILDSPLFPYMKDGVEDRKKHPKRELLHLKEEIRNNVNRVGFENIEMFEIGSEKLEMSHPYYHILQQAPVIRKRDRGTKKSKGSQMYEKDVGKRDYEMVYWNGKTFTKEYSKNVRGSRAVNPKQTTMFGNGFIINKGAKQYQNIHYQYIDNILDSGILETLATQFGLKLKRKQDTGLIDEFADQQGSSIEDIMEIFGSFME